MMPRSDSAQLALTGADVRLTCVSRRWGNATALDRVSLHVRPGSFAVLLGPSGCGKTTCLRIVAGLETASEGRVEIGGRDVTHLPPASRGVAMVFQSYALFPQPDPGMRTDGRRRVVRADRLCDRLARRFDIPRTDRT
jgi:sn-glycerol 3-phosphate transport system ATP-binding protein